MLMFGNTVNIFAHNWAQSESYGIVAHEMANALSQLGVHVNRINHPHPGTIRLAMGGFLLAYPTHFQHYPQIAQFGRRVAITMFESSDLPKGWAEACNQCDAVVVPSQWLKPVFENAGINVPVHVIPLGVSEAFFTSPRKRRKDRPFTVLMTGDRGGRKGVDVALLAWYRAFGTDMRKRLIIKTVAHPNPMISGNENPNVTHVWGRWNNRRLAQFYKSCDVMMFPTRGEGFGLPPREFAATGGIAITTNWGGTADDLDQWGIPLKITGLSTAWKNEPDETLRGVGQWAEPDIDHLAELLTKVAESREAYQEKAKESAVWVRTHYRWSDFAAKAYAVYTGQFDTKEAA